MENSRFDQPSEIQPKAAEQEKSEGLPEVIQLPPEFIKVGAGENREPLPVSEAMAKTADLYNSVLHKINDQRLFINLGVLAGWAALINHYVGWVRLLIPSFALMSIVLSFAALYFAASRVGVLIDINVNPVARAVKFSTSETHGMFYSWCDKLANVLTLIAVILLLFIRN